MTIMKKTNYVGMENFIVSLSAEEAERLASQQWRYSCAKKSDTKTVYHEVSHLWRDHYERFGYRLDIVMYYYHDGEHACDNCWLDISFLTDDVKKRKTRARTMVEYAISTVDNASHELYDYEYHKYYYIA